MGYLSMCMLKLSPSQIADVQRQQTYLAKQVITTNQCGQISTVAGVDVAYHEATSQVVGAITVLDATSLEIIESQTVIEPISFQYIPGLFSFRELPPLVYAFNLISTRFIRRSDPTLYCGWCNKQRPRANP